MPLHTLRADIDYATYEAHTTYGVLASRFGYSRVKLLVATMRARNLVAQQPAKPLRVTATCFNQSVQNSAKMQKGRNRGLAQRGSKVSFGEYALKATGRGRITARQIEAARRAMTRHIKRGGKIWIRIFPDKPITGKAARGSSG